MTQSPSDGYTDDPEVPEETPEFLNEMFSIFRSRGYQPKDLFEKRMRVPYAAWLRAHPAE